MAAKSPKKLSMLLIMVSMAVLVLTGRAQLSPQPSATSVSSQLLSRKDAQRCFAHVADIEKCIVDILNPLFIGTISSACCRVVTEIGEDCLPKWFSFTPFFPPLLKSSCPPRGIGQFASAKFFYPGLPQPGGLTPEVVLKCWSSLTNIPGCVTEVLGSLFTTPPGIIGPVCCKAVTEITDNCWAKMFPFTPFFPPLLKGFCPQSQRAPPLPK